MESFGFLSDNGQGFLNDIGIDPMESMEFLQPPYTKNESQFDLPFGGKNNEQQNHRYQAASKNMPVYIQSESSRTLQNHIQETIPPNRHSQSHQQQETEPMAIEYSPRIRQLPMRPPLPPAEFETPHQTQLQMAPSRVRVNSEMDLPIEEIGTVPIDQIDRESHVILPDGKQIVLLQLLEDGSYAQIRGDNVSKNVVFSQTKENPTLRISNADDYQPAPSIPTSEYDSRQVYDENQKTEINGSMSQDNGINIKQYHPTSQEDEQSAERRRRSSMKQGFDHLETLLNETMANTPGHTVPTKISKAGLLMKAKDTIIRHQMEKKRKQQEIDLLRRECENLQQQISCAQVGIFGEIKEEIKKLRSNFQKLVTPSRKCAAIKISENFWRTLHRERNRTTNSFHSI
ncbi:unnamed protein product [Oikopleura dioica]|uniref:BHLH domain-containing protein n=1 Tax=Oikopleura dioica TaxID=34765 RepID=E4Y762_OIKDI|nr:unnamed protein product [Oikopleura dioica]